MYETDISSIAAATEDTTDSQNMDVSDVETVAAQIKATGANASASGNVVAKIVTSIDGANFDTTVFATVTVALSGTSAVRATELINIRGCNSLRITAIENEDASFAASSVNVAIGKTIV